MTVTQCPPHRWLISPPDGETSLAVCRKCHETKRMWNTLASERDGSLQFRAQMPKKQPTSVLPITGGKW